MKRIPWLLFLTLFCGVTLAQNQAYYVKQTQVSNDLNTYKPLDNNPVFSEILIKENGIEFSMTGGKYTFIDKKKINKVNLGEDGFRYEIDFAEGMDVTMFFTPDPQSLGTFQLFMTIVGISGLVKSDPKLMTFYRLIFNDSLVMK